MKKPGLFDDTVPTGLVARQFSILHPANSTRHILLVTLGNYLGQSLAAALLTQNGGVNLVGNSCGIFWIHAWFLFCQVSIAR